MNLRKIAVACLAMSCLAGTAAAQVVTVSGAGETELLALTDAKRTAIEQVVGSELRSETVVRDYAVQSDTIYSRSQGFAKSVDILSSTQQGGLWRVTARIDVGERPGLASGHAYVALYPFDLKGIISPEKGWQTDELNVIDEYALNQLEGTGQFVMFDRKHMQEVEAERARAMAKGDYISLLVGSGQLQGAQYVALGSLLGLTTRRGETTIIGGGTKRASVRATVSLRIVDVETGAVVLSAIGRNQQTNRLLKAPLGLVRIGTQDVDKRQVEDAISGAIDDAVNGQHGLMARLGSTRG